MLEEKTYSALKYQGSEGQKNIDYFRHADLSYAYHRLPHRKKKLKE